MDDSIDSSTQGGRLTLAIISAVAEIVRLIFARYLQLDGQINSVVRWLKENGYKRAVKGVEQPFNLTIFDIRVLGEG